MSRLTKGEKAILKSYENGEWQSVENLNSKIKEHRAYAKRTLKKNKRVNIRISAKDLEGIQRIAVEEGLPYQTFIASVLHKYVSGRLKVSGQHA